MVFPQKRRVIDATIVLMKHFEFKFKTTKQRNFCEQFWYSIKVLKLMLRFSKLTIVLTIFEAPRSNKFFNV